MVHRFELLLFFDITILSFFSLTWNTTVLNLVYSSTIVAWLYKVTKRILRLLTGKSELLRICENIVYKYQLHKRFKTRRHSDDDLRINAVADAVLLNENSNLVQLAMGHDAYAQLLSRIDLTLLHSWKLIVNLIGNALFKLPIHLKLHILLIARN